MKKAIIGYTGFVGSNLVKNMKFDDYYNSQNIEEIKGKEYDFVISTGISGIKYIANKYPCKDFKKIKKYLNYLKSLKKIEKLILISTVDVYSNLNNVDEDSELQEEGLHHYGKNRLYVENYIKENFQNYLIVRLPALFGINLKKNFLYDLVVKIPPILLKKDYEKNLNNLNLENRKFLENSYNRNLDGDYDYNGKNRLKILEILEMLDFLSIKFTDFRSKYQFYNLNNLKEDIEIALENNIKILNITSEPLTSWEIAQECFDYKMTNKLEDEKVVSYNIKSKYYKLYGGKEGYLYNKEHIIKEIKDFFKSDYILNLIK